MKSGTDGTGVLASHVYAACFGFGGGRYDVFDGLAEHVDGAVGTVAVLPSKVVMSGGATSCAWLDEVGCVRGHLEDHVAGVVADHGVWISMEVLHEHVRFLNRVCCGRSLFGDDFIQSREDTRVASAAVIQERAVDGLDTGGTEFVEWLGGDSGVGCCWAREP